jgi:hypothetical protein
MKYLKEFIIGSSYIVFFPYFYSVNKLSNKQKNYSYYEYTLVAPIWLGLWNVLSLIIAEKYNLTDRMRFIVISIISSICIMIIATKIGSYNYTNEKWMEYYFYIFLKYFFVWNFVVYNLEKYLK